MRRINLSEGLESDVPKNIPIEDYTELIPGMLIRDKTEKEGDYLVVFSQPCRDGVVTGIDDCGHTSLVEAWNGNYEIISQEAPKVRIAYGKTSTGLIRISKGYYYSEDDFRKHHPASTHWYVEALEGTKRIVPLKTKVCED